MRVMLRVQIVGDGFSHAPGEIVDRPEPEARRMIARGYAAPVDPVPAERAVPQASVAREERPAVPATPRRKRKS